MRLPQDARIWTIGGAVTCALALGAGYALLVGPKLSAAADQQSVAADAQSSNVALRSKVATLKREDAQQATYVSQLKTVRAELPVTDGLAALITQLQARAVSTRVSIGSITVGAVGPVAGAAAGTAPAAAATGDAASASSSGTSSTGTGSSGTGSTAPTGTAGSPSSTGTAGSTGTAAATGTGPADQLYQIQVTVLTHGSLTGERAFLTALREPGSRAALVSGTQWSAGQPVDAAAAPATTGKTGTGGSGTPASTAPSTPSLDDEADLTTTMTVFAAPESAAAAKQLTSQLTASTR